MRYCLIVVGVSIILGACSPKNESRVRDSPQIAYTVQRILPHDVNAFTQGLLIHEGQLYESTGQDSSWIGLVNVRTGIADKKVLLDRKYFGEGIAILNNKVYQITWQNKVGFVYALPSFEKVREFTYEGEGWGLTTDGTHILMSNGTDEIQFLDTATLKSVKTLRVQYAGSPVNFLNELEYTGDHLYANIWQTNLVARIDPTSGEISGFLDLADLATQAKAVNPNVDVLNGIAWHPATKTMMVTGKNWPYLFILKLN